MDDGQAVLSVPTPRRRSAPGLPEAGQRRNRPRGTPLGLGQVSRRHRPVAGRPQVGDRRSRPTLTYGLNINANERTSSKVMIGSTASSTDARRHRRLAHPSRHRTPPRHLSSDARTAGADRRPMRARAVMARHTGGAQRTGEDRRRPIGASGAASGIQALTAATKTHATESAITVGICAHSSVEDARARAWTFGAARREVKHCAVGSTQCCMARGRLLPNRGARGSCVIADVLLHPLLRTLGYCPRSNCRRRSGAGAFERLGELVAGDLLARKDPICARSPRRRSGVEVNLPLRANNVRPDRRLRSVVHTIAAPVSVQTCPSCVASAKYGWTESMRNGSSAPPYFINRSSGERVGSIRAASVKIASVVASPMPPPHPRPPASRMATDLWSTRTPARRSPPVRRRHRR